MSKEVKLKYRHFGSMRLKIPIDWKADPFESSNWVHNFLSLRWTNDLDRDLARLVVVDFLNWLEGEEGNIEYISGRYRDHTTAIRVVVLDEFMRNESDSELARRIDREVERELTELIFSATYKFGHNHGLLIDQAVLEVLSHRPLTDAIRDLIGRVTGRVVKQLDMLYDKDGFSMEHSVSYQEYNLYTLHALRNHIAPQAEWSPQAKSAIQKMDRIHTASKRLLGAALRGDGSYIPFGDSFRLPNRLILRTVFGTSCEFQALDKGQRDEFYFLAPVAGFGFMRKSIQDKYWHIGITSSNNLGSHKQWDELGIFVECDGKTIVDDAGYTDALDKLKVWCKSRLAHSVPILISSQSGVIERTYRRPNESWVGRYEQSGLEGFVAKALYENNCELQRILLPGVFGGLLIIDWCTRVGGALMLGHRFLLGQDVLATPSGGDVWLDSEGRLLLKSSLRDEVGVEKVDVAGRDKSKSEKRMVLNWINDGEVGAFLICKGEKVASELSCKIEASGVTVGLSSKRHASVFLPFGRSVY